MIIQLCLKSADRHQQVRSKHDGRLLHFMSSSLIQFPVGSTSSASSKRDALSTSPNGVVSSVLEPQQFEWVQYKDESSRKRARAHVTRRTRKQKEDDERQQREKRKAEKFALKLAEKSSSPSPIPPQSYQSLLTPPQSDNSDTYAAVFDLQELRTSLMIRRTLGSTKTDPFGVFPVTLDAKSYALLDHCK